MKKYLIGLYIAFLPLVLMAQLPPTQNESGIQFIEGGVGSGESEAIEKSLKSWPLLLEFSQTNGNTSEWVSGVMLVVKDSAGAQLLSRKVDGPMILLGLKPGHYLLDATYGSQKKTINVYAKESEHQKLNINWK